MRRFSAWTWPVGTAIAIAIAGQIANASSATIKVRVSDLDFEPPIVTARIGDVVEWRNEDFIDHTATERDGLWDVDIPAGKTATLTLRREGAMAYFCKFHPQMKGTIRVRP
jgi:plastocyanin